MRISKGYSLFMVPTGETYKRLTTLIDTLAAHYSAPRFVPHVTLIGDIETDKWNFIKKTEKLVADTKSFQIKVQGVDYTKELNKALFLRAEKNKELMDANKHAQEIFGLDRTYEPHMSLIYGDFTLHQKVEMIERYVRDASAEFMVDALYIFDMHGDIEDWDLISKKKLE